MGSPPPPSFGHCPKVNVLFILMSSHIHIAIFTSDGERQASRSCKEQFRGGFFSSKNFYPIYCLVRSRFPSIFIYISPYIRISVYTYLRIAVYISVSVSVYISIYISVVHIWIPQYPHLVRSGHPFQRPPFATLLLFAFLKKDECHQSFEEKKLSRHSSAITITIITNHQSHDSINRGRKLVHQNWGVSVYYYISLYISEYYYLSPCISKYYNISLYISKYHYIYIYVSF